ncbi:unnamed protein product [Lampetra planeri]
MLADWHGPSIADNRVSGEQLVSSHQAECLEEQQPTASRESCAPVLWFPALGAHPAPRAPPRPDVTFGNLRKAREEQSSAERVERSLGIDPPQTGPRSGPPSSPDADRPGGGGSARPGAARAGRSGGRASVARRAIGRAAAGPALAVEAQWRAAALGLEEGSGGAGRAGGTRAREAPTRPARAIAIAAADAAAAGGAAPCSCRRAAHSRARSRSSRVIPVLTQAAPRRSPGVEERGGLRGGEATRRGDEESTGRRAGGGGRREVSGPRGSADGQATWPHVSRAAGGLWAPPGSPGAGGHHGEEEEDAVALPGDVEPGMRWA